MLSDTMKDAAQTARKAIKDSTHIANPANPDGSFGGALTSAAVGLTNHTTEFAAGAVASVVDGAADLTHLAGSVAGMPLSTAGLVMDPNAVAASVMQSDDCSGYVGQCTMNEDIKQVIVGKSTGEQIASVGKAVVDGFLGVLGSFFHK